MEPLTWTGPLGELLNPLIRSVTFVFLIAIAVQVVAIIALPRARGFNPDGTIQIHFLTNIINLGVRYSLYTFIINDYFIRKTNQLFFTLTPCKQNNDIKY